MRNIIKKILAEEFDWVDEIPSEPIVVTVNNVYKGAKVKLRANTRLYHQNPGFDGSIELQGGDILYAYPRDGDNNYWVWVEFDNGYSNPYAVGPEDFDLEFVS